MTLIAKCFDLEMLVEGAWHRFDPAVVLLHDPSGEYWPKSSCLLSSFHRSPSVVVDKASAEARAWASDPEAVRQGQVELPPKSLGAWDKVGRVSRIHYVRVGAHAAAFYHDFPERKLWIFHTDYPMLRRRGVQLRLDLPAGQAITWRGFVPG